MFDDKRSHGLWHRSASPALATGPLVGDLAADVVIIGGGYTGCSAALHLAQAGKNAVLIEAADIGFGGAGRNVGLVNAGLWVMPNDLPRILGEVHGERLLAQLGEAPKVVFDLIEKYAVECEATRNGTLHCAVGTKGVAEITERARQWQARGADVLLLDRKETAQRTGSRAYSGALLDRRAGTIQPLSYARGLANAAMTEGAQIYTQSPVVASNDDGMCWTVKTRQGSATAPWLIIATDAYTQGPFGAISSAQVKLPYFNFATLPLGADLRRTILPGREGAWDTKKILSSFRFDMSGRLIFGGVGALRGTGTAIHRAWSRRHLAKLFPQLENVEFEHEWYGQIGMTMNAVPCLHQHGRNAYSISGFNGRGIAPGTSFGRDLAQLVTGEVSVSDLSLPLTTLKPAALGTVKAAFYELGSQAAHLLASRF